MEALPMTWGPRRRQSFHCLVRGRAEAGCTAMPGRRRTRPAPPTSVPMPYGPPPPGSTTVLTDDGVRLHVEVDGDPEAPLTVVFSHAFTARLVEWDRQRAALRNRARLVLWDQGSHGRFGWTKLTAATIDRTG